MSPRTFARRFQRETGTTPYRRLLLLLLRQRVLLAQELLEGTDKTVETEETEDAIAGRSGLGNAAHLRHHFPRTLGTTPNVYRRTFRGPTRVA